MIRILVVFYLLFGFIYANNTLILDGNSFKYDDFKIRYFKDYSKKLTINEIEKKDFKGISTNAFSLGYSDNNTWLKINILNKTKREKFILSLNETFYEMANLFYKKNGKWQKIENGLLKPIEKRQIPYNKLSFIVSLPQNISSTIYIELYGKYAYFGKILIYNKDAFLNKHFFDSNSFFIFIFGITFMILIFAIGLSITLKERIYYYYTAYIFTNLIYLIKISGILVFFNLQQYIYVIHMSVAYLCGFFILFSAEYLEFDRYLKKYSRVLKLSSIIYFFIGFMFFFQYEPWNRVLNNASLILLLILLPLSIYIYLKGSKKSIYYTLAQVIYFFFAILFTLMLAGVLEYNNITRYSITLGSALENLIFLVLIIKRYNEIKEDKLKMQRELIEIKTSHETLLKNKVKKRTEELIASNNKLTILLEERELLLKEIIHRVKNNFHMIIGMLWMEGQKYEDLNIFSQLINRIKSMSDVHEFLLRDSEDISKIEAKSYFKNIIKNIIESYADKRVNIDYSIPDIYIRFENIVSLSIIINEIVNNSIKHHYAPDNIKIMINLKKDENIMILQIKDNGEGIDLNSIKEGLGMKLVKDYAKKLKNSSFSFTIDNGMFFNLIYERE